MKAPCRGRGAVGSSCLRMNCAHSSGYLRSQQAPFELVSRVMKFVEYKLERTLDCKTRRSSVLRQQTPCSILALVLGRGLVYLQLLQLCAWVMWDLAIIKRPFPVSLQVTAEQLQREPHLPYVAVRAMRQPALSISAGMDESASWSRCWHSPLSIRKQGGTGCLPQAWVPWHLCAMRLSVQMCRSMLETEGIAFLGPKGKSFQKPKAAHQHQCIALYRKMCNGRPRASSGLGSTCDNELSKSRST